MEEVKVNRKAKAKVAVAKKTAVVIKPEEKETNWSSEV